jgi:hypothetical protein
LHCRFFPVPSPKEGFLVSGIHLSQVHEDALVGILEAMPGHLLNLVVELDTGVAGCRVDRSPPIRHLAELTSSKVLPVKIG